LLYKILWSLIVGLIFYVLMFGFTIVAYRSYPVCVSRELETSYVDIVRRLSFVMTDGRDDHSVDPKDAAVLLREITGLETPDVISKSVRYFSMADGLNEKTLRDFSYRGAAVTDDASDFMDQCDSLLFSSLKIYSMILIGRNDQTPLGHRIALQKDVLRDTRELLGSKNFSSDGFLVRHPNCRNLGISRDMISGLALLATTLDGEAKRRPFQHEEYEELTSQIRLDVRRSLVAGGGLFISPLWRDMIFGSLINPTVISMIFPSASPPFYLANDTGLIMPEPKGYVSHLNAITIMFEMEQRRNANNYHERSATLVDNFVSQNLWDEKEIEQISNQRQLKLTKKLYESDRDNLLFRALYYKAIIDSLTETSYQDMKAGHKFVQESVLGELKQDLAGALMMELKGMELEGLFPRNQLPSTSHGGRLEDYLWQRESSTWADKKNTAPLESREITWPGVDYTVLSAVILSILE
jgi:hypothetical protein